MASTRRRQVLTLAAVGWLAVGWGASAAASKAPSGSWERLAMHPFHDDRGAVVVTMPFPSTWRVNGRARQGEPSVIGPHGVKVVSFPLQFFQQRQRPMPGAEQLVQQDLVPWAARQGLKLVRQYELPEIATIDGWYMDQLYKAEPSQQQRSHAIGTEWETAGGDRFFLLVHLCVAWSRYSATWSYHCAGLQAERSHFDAARKQFIFGLSNARYELEPIMAYNRKEAERIGRSWAEFNARLARRRAEFDARQRDFVNRSNAAHDALMNNWRASNAASDASHERFIDTMTERQKVVDPSTGQHYKVESGSNHYWMNGDGQYLSTDRQDYDPNRDEAVNDQKWQELEQAK